VLQALGIAALALAVLSAVFVALLVGRRASLTRRERYLAEAELRLRPVAVAIVDGQLFEPPTLAPPDQAVLAEVVGRLSRSLSGDARVRVCMYFEGSPALVHELETVHSRRAWRRAQAAYRLGDMCSRRAVEPLLHALEDGDRDVRAAAARSLGRLQAVEAVQPLLQALVRRAVPRVIGFQAVLDVGPAALPELRSMLHDDDAGLRAEAAELIGQLGEASDGQALAQALADASAEVRARVAGALGRLASAAGASALRDALGDRVYFVRLHAARALGRIGEPEAVPMLLEQARGDRFEAARSAAEALAVSDPEALLRAAAAPGAGPHLHEAADLLSV
jgi:hypothetical protein